MLRILTLALLFLLFVNGEGFDFEPEETQNNRRFTFEDGEYEISTFMRIDWYSARNLCKMQGGQLLSIETHEENIAVLEALADYMTESFWTSGSDIDKEGLFYWDSTGAPFENFTFWGPSRPVINNTEHCVELNSEMNHMWADAECDLDRFFICEFDPCSDEVELEKEEKLKEDVLLTFTFENGTYVVPNNNATWVDAKNACKLKGMELVSIETFEENLAILDALLVMPTTHFWTSGSNMGHLDNYYWEGTGHAVGPYTGWSPGQPMYPTRFYCILLAYGLSHMWTDIPCTNAYNYICELQPCQNPN